MAYTTTTIEDSITAVGTSGNDTLDVDGGNEGSIKVNSFQGNDSVTAGQFVSGTVGMGSGTDTVIFDDANEDVKVTLGDAADTFNDNASDSVTVGGQGGADTFLLDDASTKSRYAGGQGVDTFVVTGAMEDATVVGGSENDVFTVDAAAEDLFLNGQNGEDSITIDTAVLAGSATLRGGADNDTIAIAFDMDGVAVFGDKGADTITDTSGQNSLNGGDGADTIDSQAGADTITAGGGADRLEFAEAQSGTLDAAVTFATVDEAGTNVFTLEDEDGAAGSEIVFGFSSADTAVLEETVFTAEKARNAYDDAVDGRADDAGTAYFVYGTYNAALGTFTTAANGADSLLFTEEIAGGDFTATADYVVFKNYQLAASDIAFADLT